MPKCTGTLVPAQREPLDQEDTYTLDAGLTAFWDGLNMEDRSRILRVTRKTLFEAIRRKYCSRCFGLFSLRYDELRHCALDCPACHEYYAGLVVKDDGGLTLEQKIVDSSPFPVFWESALRERERDIQFMSAGDICGSGWSKQKSRSSVCQLHFQRVPYEALVDFFNNLPDDGGHKEGLFCLNRDDFEAELDGIIKYQLRICKDCRPNITRAYRELKPSKNGEQRSLEICDGHLLRVSDLTVWVDGSSASALFEAAEAIEDFKAADPDDYNYDSPERIRHCETPESAREALQDAVLLLFKSQVEVAFREQTAGHNALLLFVHLTLQMMEEQLQNAFKDVRAKQAEAELLELVADDEKRKSKKKSKKKKGKGCRKDEAACSCAACEPAAPHQDDASQLPACSEAAGKSPAASPHHRPSHDADGSTPDAAAAASPTPSVEEDICSPVSASEAYVVRRLEVATAAGGGDEGGSSATSSRVASPMGSVTESMLSESLAWAEEGSGWEVQQRSRRGSIGSRRAHTSPERRLAAPAAAPAAAAAPQRPCAGSAAPHASLSYAAVSAGVAMPQRTALGWAGVAAVASLSLPPQNMLQQPLPAQAAAPPQKWGRAAEQQAVPMQISRSRESLATASDMSCASSPGAAFSAGTQPPPARHQALAWQAQPAQVHRQQPVTLDCPVEPWLMGQQLPIQPRSAHQHQPSNLGRDRFSLFSNLPLAAVQGGPPTKAAMASSVDSFAQSLHQQHARPVGNYSLFGPPQDISRPALFL